MKSNTCARAMLSALACLTLQPAAAQTTPEEILQISPQAHAAVLTEHFADPPFERLSRPPKLQRVRTGIGHGWRHDYDLVLTRTGETFVIFDSLGQRHEFRHTGATSALRQRGRRHEWTRTSGEIVQFDRGVPTRIDHPTRGTTRLGYQDGLLVSVDTEHRPPLTLAYEDGQLQQVAGNSGTTWHLQADDDGSLTISRSRAKVTEAHANTRQCEPDDPEPDSPPCDADASPPPVSFIVASELAAETTTATTWIDARPASCRSYFVDYYGTDRGFALEQGLADQDHYAGYEPTVRSFPIVDFIGDELRVVRSRDLALRSYDGEGLYQTLLDDGDDIARLLLEPLRDNGSITVRESGRVTTLTQEPERPIVLEVVIRHGIASAAQRSQLQRAGDILRTQHGIQLRVIEIP